MAREGTENTNSHTQFMGDAYAYGNFMYEKSRIARNQIHALNIKIYAMYSGMTDEMGKSLEVLKQEADQLVEDPTAIREYADAKKLWLERKKSYEKTN